MNKEMSESIKYYWMSPKDQRFNIWIFHLETNETGARLREEYLPLKCSRCGKFDELKALEMGVPQGIRIRSKSDYLVSHDGIVCISNEGQQALTEAGVSGLRFLAIPGNGGYSIALPHSFVPTDPDLSQMKFHRQCKQCGRFRETCFKPALASMSVPNDPMSIFCPDIHIESIKERVYWYFASEGVVAELRNARLTGVEFNIAY